MRLQVFSDLHLEFGSLQPAQTDADVIIAAGDIGIQAEGVQWLQQFNKPVIYVAGNHEYWGGDIYTTGAQIKKACKGSQIHYLENERCDIAGVRFLGCTLWTDLGTDPDTVFELWHVMNDFSYIANGNNALLPEDVIELNRSSVVWLRRALQQPWQGKTVIVTHHAPCLQSWKSAEHDLLKYAYCNELADLLHVAPAALWVHGHIHSPSDYHINGTRVVCNPRGYYNYRIVEEFLPDKMIEI